MRIGVDASCWQNTRGYGRCVRALLSTLVALDGENQYIFFMDSLEDMEALPSQAEVRSVRTSAPTVLAASSRSHRSLHDMWQMSRAMSAPEFDLLFFPTVYSFVPVFSRARRIVMIMDIIAEKHPRLTLPTHRARLFWRAKVALGRWQADLLVTLSEYSRLGIIEHFKVAPERVAVVGAASAPVFRVIDDPHPTPRLDSLGIDANGRALVYVGGFGPHKNLEALVAVFAQLAHQDAFCDVRLILVGEYEKEVFHSSFQSIKRQIADFGIEERVLFTGYLPDEDLVVLLNLSTVLVLPSLMEGFGLPAIEAAACGCPVIATSASPLPGLLGDGGLYVDPTKPEDLELALIRVLSSEGLRQCMRAAGLAAATELTWDVAARRMMGLMREVIAR